MLVEFLQVSDHQESRTTRSSTHIEVRGLADGIPVLAGPWKQVMRGMHAAMEARRTSHQCNLSHFTARSCIFLGKIVNNVLGEAAKHFCARFQKQHHSARPIAPPAAAAFICLQTCRRVPESIALRNRRRSQHAEKGCTRYYLPATSLLALLTGTAHTWISEACQECNGFLPGRWIQLLTMIVLTRV